jgi:release factor glutamine methyltransferase
VSLYVFIAPLHRSHFVPGAYRWPLDAAAGLKAFYLLEDNHNFRQIDLALTPDLKFSDAEIQVWDTILDQLKLEIPIQYLLVKLVFMD